MLYSQVYLKENQTQLHLNGFVPRHRIFTQRQFHDKFSLSSCTHEQAQLIDSYRAKCLCSKPDISVRLLQQGNIQMTKTLIFNVPKIKHIAAHI